MSGTASAPSTLGAQNTPSTRITPKPQPVQPAGGSLLAGGISIKVAPPKVEEATKVHVEAKPLEQADIERYWKEASEELNLADLMSAATVTLGENHRTIDINATETWFAADFRPHRIEVMQRLREKSGMPMLECNVIPLFVSKDTIIYTAEEKYRAMLDRNPHLAEMRKLFPEIDL